MKKRVAQMTTASQARREAAWEPLIDCIRSEPFPDDAFALMHRWRQFPEQTKEAGWAQLPPWGSEAPEKHARAWNEWCEQFDAVLESKGVGEGFPGVFPQQAPPPPDEPPGLWERLHAVAEATNAENWQRRCAAAYALLWLAIARSLRHFEALSADTT